MGTGWTQEVPDRTAKGILGRGRDFNKVTGMPTWLGSQVTGRTTAWTLPADPRPPPPPGAGGESHPSCSPAFGWCMSPGEQRMEEKGSHPSPRKDGSPPSRHPADSPAVEDPTPGQYRSQCLGIDRLRMGSLWVGERKGGYEESTARGMRKGLAEACVLDHVPFPFTQSV